MFLTGTHELQIDPKNRLSIPSTIRAKIQGDAEGRTTFYVTPGDIPRTLKLFEEGRFEEFAQACEGDLVQSAAKEDFQRIFYALSAPVETDVQGRVVLPQVLLDHARIDKQVTLSGSGDHLVVWEREAYKRYMEDNGYSFKPKLEEARRITLERKRMGVLAE